MRVSHVINGLGIGGAERALLRLVQDTSGEVSHSIVCLTDIDSLRAQFEQVPGTRVHLLGARRGLRGASAVWSCARWLSDSRPQLVHAWLKQSCAIAGLATAMMPSLRRVPLVWGVHDTVERAGASASERVALAVGRVLSHRWDLLLSNSALALEQLASAGYRPRRAQVLHNGVEFPAWEAVQAERVGRRAALGIPPDAPVVLHVGTTHPSKDPACLLRCVEEVHRHVPGVVVIRAGRPPLPGEATADALALMRPGRRVRTRTWSPHRKCASTSARPMKPVPPVTATVIIRLVFLREFVARVRDTLTPLGLGVAVEQARTRCAQLAGHHPLLMRLGPKKRWLPSLWIPWHSSVFCRDSVCPRPEEFGFCPYPQ